MVLGTVAILFFQCINALLSPTNQARGNIQWVLAAHTVTMFLLVTIFTAMYLTLQSIIYIDTREFPGNDTSLPGPIGYQHFIYSEAISLVPRVIFMLNNWLADGLLVSSQFNPVTWVSNMGRSSSSIVAVSFMP